MGSSRFRGESYEIEEGGKATTHLIDRELGARGDLFERDIPVLAVPLKDHVHEAQEGYLLLRKGGAAHQGGLC